MSQAGSKRESRASRSSRRQGSSARGGGEGGSGVSERTVRASGGGKVRSERGSAGSVKRSVVGFLQGM